MKSGQKSQPANDLVGFLRFWQGVGAKKVISQSGAVQSSNLAPCLSDLNPSAGTGKPLAFSFAAAKLTTGTVATEPTQQEKSHGEEKNC